MGHVLFVCTGNTCRSPMAGAIFHHLWSKQTNWTVASAGLHAIEGSQANPHAIEAVAELGIDLTAHRAQNITADLIDQAEIVVVMTKRHCITLKSRFPEAVDKISLIKNFSQGNGGPMDLVDPYGGSLVMYKGARDEIVECLTALCDSLTSRK